jgi:hypothetical protein
MSQEQAKLAKRIEAGKPIFKDKVMNPGAPKIQQPGAKPAGPSPTLQALAAKGQKQGQQIQQMRQPGGAMNNMLKKK